MKLLNLSSCKTCKAVCLSFNIIVACYNFNCNIPSCEAFKDYFLKGVGKVRMTIKSYLKCDFMVVLYYSPEVWVWNCCGLWGNLWGITEKKVLKHDSLAQLFLRLHWNEFSASGTSLIISLVSLSNYSKRNCPILKYAVFVTNCWKLESWKDSVWIPRTKAACVFKCRRAFEMSHAVTSVLSMTYSFLVFQLELFYFSGKIILSHPKREMEIQFCGYWNYLQVWMKFKC